MRGMPLLYSAMPDKTNFAKFFSKYMLIFEGIKNRGIAFSPLIKKLVDAESMEELEPVSYTHLDVYKRQSLMSLMNVG